MSFKYSTLRSTMNAVLIPIYKALRDRTGAAPRAILIPTFASGISSVIWLEFLVRLMEKVGPRVFTLHNTGDNEFTSGGVTDALHRVVHQSMVQDTWSDVDDLLHHVVTSRVTFIY